MSFTNKVAVITGASGGIGSALAMALASVGCKVGLVARREQRLRELAGQIENAGSQAAVGIADIGRRDQVLAAMDSICAQLGPIDLLIANAGLGELDQLDPFSAEHYERMMRVNWVGLVNAIEAVLPGMMERKAGHLAAISSLRAYRGFPGFAGYCATKAAINTFLEGLRVDLAGCGIAVTTVCPGFVKTDMMANKDFPKPWIMEPEDAARQILWAIRRKRKVHSFPWQLALITRISRIAPDWMISRFAPR